MYRIPILLIFLFGSNLAFNQVTYNINGVYEPSETEVESWGILELPEEASGFIAPDIPGFFDLSATNLFPTPGNQGSIGSCTAWALCYSLKTYQEAIENRYSIYKEDGTLDNQKIFSPSFLFNLSKNMSPDCRSGVHLKTALDNLKAFGTVPLATMPYSNDLNDCSSPPKNDLFSESINYRILEYYIIRDRTSPGFKKVDIEKIKRLIFNGKPIVFAMEVDDKWLDNGILANYKNSIEYVWKDFSIKKGYHAMVAVGYDNEKQAIKTLNSFGENWVNGGYIWIDYNLFKRKVKEAYSVEDFNSYYRNLYKSFHKQTNTDKIFEVQKYDNNLVLKGKIINGEFVEIEGYKIYFEGVSENGKNTLYKLANIENGRSELIGNIEVEVGGENNTFIYKDKLFNFSTEKIVSSLFSSNEKSLVTLSITNQ